MTKHLWNCDTSWRCVQALVVILTILLLPGSGALDPGIDLLEALNLHSNLSQYPGVTISPSRVFHLSGLDRNLVLPAAVFHRAVEQMKKSSEFTFSVVVKQEESNSGTIVSFSNGINRYLELQSSGRRDEIRFHYTHITAAGATEIETETFPYRLADDTEHKVSLTVSGTEMQLFIDCHPLYKRVTKFLPDRNFSASNMQLFVGQRNSNSHFLFKGVLKDLRLITSSYGYLSQCELMDAQCPTCGQFLELENALLELKQTMSLLTKRLVEAEKRVSYIEECDCKKSCLINGTTKNDGESWDVGCSRCECKQGEVKCGPRPCPAVKCKHPVLKEGECCPVCLKSCYITKKDFEHGEIQILGCRNCSCVDGNMHCEFLQCPELKCPPEQQMSVTDECCKFCQGVDYCSKGHSCHTNATCLNLNTKYTCTCRSGFHGDGYYCSDTPHRRKARPQKRPHGGSGGSGSRRQHHKNSTHRNKNGKKKKHDQAMQLHVAEDVDECAQQGGLNGNHCHMNTRCVNTFGSYVCECLPGYRRQNKFNCVEIDECKSGEHRCHKHAECTNTLGSYHCTCKKGYAGDGSDCRPVCNQTCLNGGECRSPGVCVCRPGYVGESCEKDLDECATGLHRCKETTDCVNMPGWYFCKCKPGFESKGRDCVDIDECAVNTHSCHHTALCVNTEGHFECQCPPEAEQDCRLSCMFEDRELKDGEQVAPNNTPCKVCTCSRGVVNCVEPSCNCSSWRPGVMSELCCPQCDPKQSCQHQELSHVTFRSGEQWIYECQTCECLYGEFDCWKLECPPLSCDNPLPVGPTDCCPRCPDDMCGLENGTDITSSSSPIAGVGSTCLYEKHIYASGQTFKYPSRECTTCSCKNGKITCRYNDNCTDADNSSALRVVQNYDADDEFQFSVANHKPPQAATTEMLGRQHQQHYLNHLYQTGANAEGYTTKISSNSRLDRHSRPISTQAHASASTTRSTGTNNRYNSGTQTTESSTTDGAVCNGSISASPAKDRIADNYERQHIDTMATNVTMSASSDDMVDGIYTSEKNITSANHSNTIGRAGLLLPDVVQALPGASPVLSNEGVPVTQQHNLSADSTTTTEKQRTEHRVDGGVGAMTVSEDNLAAIQVATKSAGATKTELKRSLLQMLPSIGRSSLVDFESIAASSKRRAKRSERG